MHSHAHLAPAPSPAADGEHERARVRVLLAEDHATMRRSLRLLLDQEPDIDVVAESSELSAAINQVCLLHPDVVVLDLRMPDGSNAEILERVRARAPQTAIVVITMHEGQAFAQHAHRSGALGFVLKDTADDELPDAVRCAARGELYTSPRVTPRVVPLRLA